MKIPKSKAPDNTLQFLMEGYKFLPRREEYFQTNIFETRLLFQDFICIKGEEAAKLFYDTELFERKGVAPTRIKNTLFGKGGVQGLDGEEHRVRKEIFMSLMSERRIQELSDLVLEQWKIYAKKWEQLESVTLFNEIEEIICRAVCEWSGVPLNEEEVEQRTWEFSKMIESAGAAGPRHWQGKRGRKNSEKWMIKLVEDVRNGKLNPDEETVLFVFANAKDTKGDLLDTHTAAVEIINITRPTIAVGRFITFAALALHEYPEYKTKLQNGSDKEYEHFVQEVRRFYPFFPVVVARTKKEFEWNGYKFPKGQKVMLDLYGTNRDQKLWKDADEFFPERFEDWDGSPYNFIPQGGGDHYKNHRCPGEWITIALMKTSISFLINSLEYEVPEQDLHFSMSRIPTLPKSRFIIKNVKLKK